MRQSRETTPQREHRLDQLNLKLVPEQLEKWSTPQREQWLDQVRSLARARTRDETPALFGQPEDEKLSYDHLRNYIFQL